MLKIDAATSGKGMPFKMGSVLALTGSGSFYGKTMSRGIDLALEHIKAAGGPDIQVKYYDHKSGDAAAGQQAITELGSAGYPAKLASYVDDLGAMLAGTAQYKMFTLDGGGGTSIFGQAQPFFWGTRAITPNDPMPGLFKWTKATYPNAKTVGLTGWDIGEPNNTTIKTDILKKIADAGYQHNGLYDLFPVGTQDFSAVLPKIKSNEPDILLFRRLRPGSRLVREPVPDGRPEGHGHRLRVHARRRERVEGCLRQGRLDLRLRLLRRRESHQSTGQAVRVRVQEEVQRLA
jgi:hypothetical protein